MVVCDTCILHHIQMCFHFSRVKDLKKMYTAALWLVHASRMKGHGGAADMSSDYFIYLKFSFATLKQLVPNLSKSSG